MAKTIEKGKCADCGETYDRNDAECPSCGIIERVLCQAMGCDQIECDDLATGTFKQGGHTFDACDDHRTEPY